MKVDVGSPTSSTNPITYSHCQHSQVKDKKSNVRKQPTKFNVEVIDDYLALEIQAIDLMYTTISFMIRNCL